MENRNDDKEEKHRFYSVILCNVSQITTSCILFLLNVVDDPARGWPQTLPAESKSHCLLVFRKPNQNKKTHIALVLITIAENDCLQRYQKCNWTRTVRDACQPQSRVDFTEWEHLYRISHSFPSPQEKIFLKEMTFKFVNGNEFENRVS